MELNAEQIIQGLRDNDSPYKSDQDNIVDAIALIKQLSEENERLKEILHTDISFVRVSRGSGKTNHLREVARLRMDAVRANTVREMQERIRTRCIKGGIYPAFVARTIDQIAKEMTNEA